MGVDDHLVHNAESVARRSEVVKGHHRHYLTYNPGPGTQDRTGQSVTEVVTVDLPEGSTNVHLRGPAYYENPDGGKIYGVQIAFTAETSSGKRELVRLIELPHPAIDVQLLDREPDEAYKSVS